MRASSLGHVVYDSVSKMLCSVGAVSIVNSRKIFDYMADNLADTEFCFPTLDQLCASFFMISI